VRSNNETCAAPYDWTSAVTGLVEVLTLSVDLASFCQTLFTRWCAVIWVRSANRVFTLSTPWIGFVLPNLLSGSIQPCPGALSARCLHPSIKSSVVETVYGIRA
jgi:hypothetical protein